MESKGKRNKNPWWIFSAIGLFLLSSGKYIVSVLKFGKFGGAILSMAITIGAYAILFPFGFAVGLVVMILIHELGHVAAAKHKGLPVTAPVFIPFLGALIMLKRHPRDAVTEAYIAYGGPLLGTIGAFATLWIGIRWEEPLLVVIANIGFFLNLINLLPIHPLDGGRISTAVTRWLWLVGLVGGLFVVYYLRNVLFFIIWAMFAWELYQKYIRNKGKGKRFEFTFRYEIPVERMIALGMMIPGEGHRRDLAFNTYSTLDGKQMVEFQWEGIGLHDTVSIPQQGLVRRVQVANIEYQPKERPEKLIVRCLIELESHEPDNYYEVPTGTRWKFGIAYGALAVFLGYMLYFTQEYMPSV